LRVALSKYEHLKSHFLQNLPQLLRHLQTPAAYKTRFLGEKSGDYYPVDATDVAYFFSEYKLSFIMTFDGARYLLEKSLAVLETELDPAQFRRANRQVIVNTRAVRRIGSVGKSKLLLELAPKPPFEVVVSQEQAGAFKQWAGGV
jgi:DNA-binding LytR/AlgR family response regulator